MIRLLSFRSMLALALLCLAATALVSTLNTTIKGLGETGYLTLAIVALVGAYLLGFTNWPAYRAWFLIVFLGAPLIAVQVTHTGDEVMGFISHLPSLILENMYAYMTHQPADPTLFQDQV